MKGHRHYGKIHRLGKEETDGLLVGTVSVQEKVDGANVSIWIDADTGEIAMGSRTRVLRGDEEFNGFIPYVKAHEGIRTLLAQFPDLRLYGEWLVRHTIAYKETAYKKFYLFDIWNDKEEKFFTADGVKAWASHWGIDTVPMHGTLENPTMEQLMEFVGKSEFGDRGEGIVLKNYDFTNGFGEKVFAKIVTESFKEDNGVAFGGNNKFSDTYQEMRVVNKYMTLTRVKKVMDKIQPEVNKRLDMEHIPRICNTAYHDMLVEEIWAIAKDAGHTPINFAALNRIASKKAKQIFIDIINDTVNIHDMAAVHRAEHPKA